MNRYSRQTLFNKIGSEGQRLIQSRTVLIVGVGALGSLSGEMLARAGVEKIILIDRDYVEMSNLQRQTLYTEDDAANKVQIGRASCRERCVGLSGREVIKS